MLIHTAIKNGNIPPVRGVTGLPGAMSGCGATCTSRGLPGVVGISGRSEVARWKATVLYFAARRRSQQSYDYSQSYSTRQKSTPPRS